MIRMHRYEDGREGLTAFCDICGEQITKHGYVVWSSKEPRDWLVVHQSRCDPGRPRYDLSMPLDIELVYLANSTGSDLDAAKKNLAELKGFE